MSYKNILTYGTYDVLHYGHIRLLKRAKAFGEMLYVGLSSDAFNATKGKVSAMSYDARHDILSQIKPVDFIFPEQNWDQKIADIEKYAIDCFVMGSDWQGKFDHLKQYCDVVYLDRTKNISSSLIRKSASLPKQYATFT